LLVRRWVQGWQAPDVGLPQDWVNLGTLRTEADLDVWVGEGYDMQNLSSACDERLD
jgi:hypothetical protein